MKATAKSKDTVSLKGRIVHIYGDGVRVDDIGDVDLVIPIAPVSDARYYLNNLFRELGAIVSIDDNDEFSRLGVKPDVAVCFCVDGVSIGFVREASYMTDFTALMAKIDAPQKEMPF